MYQVLDTTCLSYEATKWGSPSDETVESVAHCHIWYKDSSLLKGISIKCRPKVCIPSPAMMTYPLSDNFSRGTFRNIKLIT